MSAEWKPKVWVVILVGFFLQAFVFLYVNRPKLFWLYLGASLFVEGIEYLRHRNLVAGSWYEDISLGWIFVFVCPIHAYLVTRSYDRGQVRGWYSQWWAIPSIFITVSSTAFIMAFIIRAFLFEPYRISSDSMRPNFGVEDRVVIKKWGFGGYETYGVSVFDAAISDSVSVERGGVYTFRSPDSDSATIKRAIGLPGDVVEIDGDEVIVNGKTLLREFVSGSGTTQIFRETNAEKSYLIQENINTPFYFHRTFRLGENDYFFLGDNRDLSKDSRSFGTISNRKFLGEVIYVF